jgi:hypothetical protein
MTSVGGKIEIRKMALELNKRKNVTDKFVMDLRKKLVGKEIEILGLNNQWNLLTKSILVLK